MIKTISRDDALNFQKILEHILYNESTPDVSFYIGEIATQLAEKKDEPSKYFLLDISGITNLHQRLLTKISVLNPLNINMEEYRVDMKSIVSCACIIQSFVSYDEYIPEESISVTNMPDVQLAMLEVLIKNRYEEAKKSHEDEVINAFGYLLYQLNKIKNNDFNYDDIEFWKKHGIYLTNKTKKAEKHIDNIRKGAELPSGFRRNRK